ncbi:MAG: hypothetical protein R3C12_11090 [Planctomycetaceae bacterium]
MNQSGGIPNRIGCRGTLMATAEFGPFSFQYTEIFPLAAFTISLGIMKGLPRGTTVVQGVVLIFDFVRATDPTPHEDPFAVGVS